MSPYNSYNYFQNIIKPSYFKNDSVVAGSGINITVQQVRDAIGIYGDDTEDSYIQQLILSADEVASNYIGNPITAVTRVDYYTRFTSIFELSAKFTTTTSTFVINYFDENENEQTWSSDNYIVDKTTKYITIIAKNNVEFPVVSSYFKNPIKITYSAGVPSELESPVIKRAIIGIAVELYNYGLEGNNYSVKDLPFASLGLLDYLKDVIIWNSIIQLI